MRKNTKIRFVKNEILQFISNRLQRLFSKQG